MPEDISPELYNQIKTRFNTLCATDKRLSTLVTTIRAGKGTQELCNEYATRIGKHASEAFNSVLTAENLPNGTLYWNIAEKTIKPLMLENYERINSAATLTQAALDQAIDLNVGIVKGGYPENRVDQVMNFAANAETGEPLKNALSDPVITGHQKFFDDFLKENARLRSELGLYAVVTRLYDGKGLHGGRDECGWCLERSGTWSYEEANRNGVFERHPGCGCTITYTTSKGHQVQTDWTTNTWADVNQ